MNSNRLLMKFGGLSLGFGLTVGLGLAQAVCPQATFDSTGGFTVQFADSSIASFDGISGDISVTTDGLGKDITPLLQPASASAFADKISYRFSGPLSQGQVKEIPVIQFKGDPTYGVTYAETAYFAGAKVGGQYFVAGNFPSDLSQPVDLLVIINGTTSCIQAQPGQNPFSFVLGQGVPNVSQIPGVTSAESRPIYKADVNLLFTDIPNLVSAKNALQNQLNGLNTNSQSDQIQIANLQAQVTNLGLNAQKARTALRGLRRYLSGLYNMTRKNKKSKSIFKAGKRASSNIEKILHGN